MSNPSVHYYISSGAKNGYYTLRRVFQGSYGVTDPTTGAVDMIPLYEDKYERMLATDWDRALTKARESIGKNELLSDEPFELTPFGRNKALWQFVLLTADPYALPFGKYVNQDMREVVKADPEYLYWMLDALYNKDVTASRNYWLIPKRVALALLVGEAAAEHKAAKQREREERRAAIEAAKRPCPEGRIVVRGKVIKMAEYASDWGVTTKMTVACDGFAVFGTCNASGIDVGMMVEFTATVTRSERDESFGFFKRPHNITIVEGVV